MEKYTARITHSEDTIKAMAKAQYESFRPKSYYYVFIAALLMLAIAVFWQGMPNGLQILFVAVGCFSLVGLNSPPRRLAEQVIKNLNGNFPRMGYLFTDESVQLTGADAATELKYKEILLLVEDPRYFYIFIQNRSAYMIERSSVRPDAGQFKAFVSAKTGLRWTRNTNPLNKNLEKLRFERVKTRL